MATSGKTHPKTLRKFHIKMRFSRKLIRSWGNITWRRKKFEEYNEMQRRIGAEEAMQKIVRKLVEKEVPIETIAEVTGLEAKIILQLGKRGRLRRGWVLGRIGMRSKAVGW
jgi:hypothetical protein